MGRHAASRSMSSMSARSMSTVSGRSDSASDDCELDLDCPFGRLDGLSNGDLRESAYEVYFMSCRWSPGMGSSGRGGALNYYPSSPTAADHGDGTSSPTFVGGVGPRGGTGMNMVNSRIKKALGLKTRRSSQPMTRQVSGLANGGAAAAAAAALFSTSAPQPASPGRVKRPMTSAEIMRQQLRVMEHTDTRLRKTLTRSLVGQVGRRAETIILPLELLRQLKSSEFADPSEYHQWQRRQLGILEAGLLQHPSLPIDRLGAAASRLREVIRAGEAKPIDTSKSSDAMRALCSAVLALAWRSGAPASGASPPPNEPCHWADGYPLNVLLYLQLLQTVFDRREETVVLDEVDELMELFKRTWPTLGINKAIHNVCFTWVLFRQYVITGQTEPDLAGAALAMLAEVANDAARRGGSQPAAQEATYARALLAMLGAIHSWSEKKAVDYHNVFEKAGASAASDLQAVMSLALTTCRILTDDVPGGKMIVKEHEYAGTASFSGDRVDYYIRTSMSSAFTKILEHSLKQGGGDGEEPSVILTQLAVDAEQLALFERDHFSPALKQWHPAPAAAAVVTLHGCFGVVLKQYLAKVTSLTNELVRVLQAAGKLEKALVQVAIEETVECDDGGKAVIREMLPYEVESIVAGLLKNWIEERLRIGRECVARAKETESWIPKSKTEPFAQSAVDLMKLAKVTVEEFFEIPVGNRDEMVHELADGIGGIVQDYTAFVAACGSKNSYMPALPPLTRCNQDSRFLRLWRRAATPCRAATHVSFSGGGTDGNNPRPSTSRGTQRLYIRLNTLHYLLGHLNALEKSLSFFSRTSSGRSTGSAAAGQLRRSSPSQQFDLARDATETAIQQVAEVAAYRLILLDSHHTFYDGLYIGGAAEARIRPALRILKQNLTLLVSMLVDRAQPLAVREVMKASFEAFVMVLLAGGGDRSFKPEDHELVEEDFQSLKRAFCTCGEGLVAEEVVDREAEVAEGIVALMALPTERIIEEFSIAACETSGFGGAGQKLPMPPTTGRWSRSDPNTILRVLCHREDEPANQFLKTTFQLPKRR